MKILMLLESFFPPDKRVENEINSLTEAGFEVHIACRARRNEKKYDKYGKTIVYRKKMPAYIVKSSVAALKIPLYFKFWKKFINSILCASDFDIVHLHDLPLSSPVYDLKKRYQFKWILDLHENWPALLDISPHTKTLFGKLICSIKQWEKYELKYLEHADHIIVVIEEAKRRLINLGLDESLVTIVSNTLARNDMEKLKIKKTPKSNEITTIIYQGGISYHRGLQYVLMAIRLLKDRTDKFEFTIIGDGSYANKLKSRCKKYGICHLVKFFGKQTQNRVYELITQSDIALIPHLKSRHTDTTIPHKLFQYMYAEIPVIASNCDPIERIIGETDCGYTYKYDDPEELANILLDLIISHKDHKTKGKSWVNRKYNWSSDEKQLIDIYRKLVK